MPTDYETGSVGTKKINKKDDGLFGKIGSLTRKKKTLTTQDDGATRSPDVDYSDVEADNIEKEGREAIDSNLLLPQPDLKNLEDGKQIRVLTIESRDDPNVQEIIYLLLYWINNELASERIVVKNIQEDIYDGQIIQKLLEKLDLIKIDMTEVLQTEEGQKHKLKIIIDTLNSKLFSNGQGTQKWTAELIHAKDIVAILHLLVNLATHYRAPIRFPNNVNVQILIYQRNGKQINKNIVTEQITTKQTELAPMRERDAFDTLFDYGPDKLQHVKNSLVAFCNKHLNKINLEVTDLENQFQDGVFLILLMGLLEGYFVPLYKFNLQVNNTEEKLKNVQFAFFLMEETGMTKPICRPHDVVNGDLKTTLRILHLLYTKYKHV